MSAIMHHPSATLLAALVLVLFANGLSAQSNADAVPDLEGSVRDLLSLGIESTATQSQWRALGADAMDVLHRIARDENEMPVSRTRAIVALGAFKTERADAMLLALAQPDVLPVDLRVAAIETLVAIEPELALAVAESALAENDPYLRRMTAQVLAGAGSQRARDLLAAAAGREEDQTTREGIESAIRKCERKITMRLLDSLVIVVENLSDDATTRGYRMRITAPADPDRPSTLSLVVTTVSSDLLVFSTPLATKLDLASGDDSEVEFRHHQPGAEVDAAFRIAITLADEPEVRRWIDVSGARQNGE